MPGLRRRSTNPEVLRILLSIGPTETMHFQTWQDKAGNAPPLTDPTTGLTFPDLNADGELIKTNLIMPEPTSLPRSEVPDLLDHPPDAERQPRPGRGEALTASGLFTGQSQNFFTALTALAQAADSAHRHGD